MKTRAMLFAAAAFFVGPAYAEGDYLHPTMQEAEGTLTIASIAITAKHFCSAEVPNAVTYHPRFVAFAAAAFDKFKADGVDAEKFVERKHRLHVFAAKEYDWFCKMHMPALADLLTSLNGTPN